MTKFLLKCEELHIKAVADEWLSFVRVKELAAFHMELMLHKE